MNECTIWKKTEIVDLAFIPFINEQDAMSRMLNESVKYIKKVKNVNSRELRDDKFEDERKFFFYKADTLIGLDISILDVTATTYLDQIFFLLKMYPMVLINSFVQKNKMKELALHSYCKDHKYILPVFGSIPFLDTALSEKYNGLIELFKGEINNIKLNNLKYDERSFTDKELEIRFPQLDVHNGEIRFLPEITWLGVDDKNIEEFLSYLFNENVEKFTIEEATDKIENLDIDLLQLYIDSSMFFSKSKDGKIIYFRMLRKEIYWSFICNLASQFEKEMIEKNAISYNISIETSIGKVKKIEEKIYHKLGNLFLNNDSFTYKMFSNIKRIYDVNQYSNLLVIDNGNMDGILSMIRGIGMQDNLFQVLDYYSVAVKYPTTNYSKLRNQKVLVIIDVINTGKLIYSTLDFLDKLGCKEIGIYSLIINQEFDVKSFIEEKNVKMFYLTEKKLNNIDEILDSEYTSRFVQDMDLNYKLLWGEVEKNILLEKNDKPKYSYVQDGVSYATYFDYVFYLKDAVDEHSFIYQKLKHLLRNIDFFILHDKYKDMKSLLCYLSEHEKNLKLIVEIIDSKTLNKKRVESKYENKNVVFLIPMNERYKIDEFIKINKISNAELFDLVFCEIFNLEKGEIIDSHRGNCHIFSSNLKGYETLSANPQISFFKN